MLKNPIPIQDGLRSTADHVYEALRLAILSKELQPGDRLVEAKIAKELNVSITPVRQAFQNLSVRGLIVIFPYKGSYVSHLTQESMAELQYVRLLIEPAAARLALSALTAEDAAYLTQLCIREDEAYQAGNLYQAIQYDTDFHSHIIARSGSMLLSEMWDIIRQRVEYAQVYTKSGAKPSGYYLARHQAIIEAIRAQDVSALNNALITHIQNASTHSNVVFPKEKDVQYK